jgi:cell filamentation protein
VTFDPFGDFKTRGYLRNLANESDLDIVRRLEHSSFTTGLDQAFAELAEVRVISYEHVLETHKILFEAIYPWAGQDRTKTAPDIAVVKGNVLFAHPADIRTAIDIALRDGSNKEFTAAKPGEVMGYLAYGHPFLDRNGRTIMVIHSVLAQRAGFSIDWTSTNKIDYLAALTKELDTPGKGVLDRYLKPFMRESVDCKGLAAAVALAPGLDGKAEGEDEFNKVLGKTSEPAVQAQYEAVVAKRKRVKDE